MANRLFFRLIVEGGKALFKGRKRIPEAEFIFYS